MHPDGRKDYLMGGETGRFACSGSTADFRVTDRNGNIFNDSKRDRIEKKKSFAELVASHHATDTLLASLLQSYNASVRDPNNELVHLYEIRDALSTKFRGENATRKALSMSASRWSRFGQLCNDEPLRQGRHRGKTGGVLRDATEDELTEARGIAQAMIDGYLQYLEASASPQ
jgi:hypothetical protein